MAGPKAGLSLEHNIMRLHILALFVAVLALAFAANAQGPGDCGPNETWKECVSSSCAEKTCTRRFIPDFCTADCSFGCYCGDNYYRNSERHCVPVEECPTE
ncbi:ixochymostatin-like [Amblyomma americanum]